MKQEGFSLERRKLDIRNIAVIAVVLVLVLGVAVFAATRTRTLEPTAGTLAADPTSAPAADGADTPRAPAAAYLVVTVNGNMYEPIPLDEEARYTVRQGEKVNTIAVTPDSICMAESTCDNQDCVLQGVVDLENRENRVLKNMILCLPHEIVLELYTAEELTDMLLGMVEQEAGQ